MVDTTTRVCTVVNTLPGGIPRSPTQWDDQRFAMLRGALTIQPRLLDEAEDWGAQGTGAWKNRWLSSPWPPASSPLAKASFS